MNYNVDKNECNIEKQSNNLTTRDEYILSYKIERFEYLPTFRPRYFGLLKPIVLEFKIPAESINAGHKMAPPRQEPMSERITLIVLSYS